MGTYMIVLLLIFFIKLSQIVRNMSTMYSTFNKINVNENLDNLLLRHRNIFSGNIKICYIIM